MNIQHLKYAVEVERVGSITLAAENLYISQPSLSKAIRELESNLGFPIFERTSRGILPTRKGKEMLDHARSILRQLSQIESLSAGGEAAHQLLSLSVPRAAYVAEAVARFAASLDKSACGALRVQELNTARTLESVSDGSCRLGIVRCEADNERRVTDAIEKKKLKSEMVWEYEPVLLLGKNSPLSQQADVSDTDLKELVQITEDTNEPLDRCILADGRALSSDLLRALPDSYMWSSPVPPSMLAAQGLIQMSAPTPRPLWRDRLVYAADCHFSAGERALIDRLFEVKNELTFAH